SVDDHFITLLGLQWKEEPAPGALVNDRHIILNETAVGKRSFSDADPVGQQLTLYGTEKETVAGALKDFNYQSLQSKVGPLCLFVGKDAASGWGRSVAGCLFGKI